MTNFETESTFTQLIQIVGVIFIRIGNVLIKLSDVQSIEYIKGTYSKLIFTLNDHRIVFNEAEADVAYEFLTSQTLEVKLDVPEAKVEPRWLNSMDFARLAKLLKMGKTISVAGIPGESVSAIYELRSSAGSEGWYYDMSNGDSRMPMSGFTSSDLIIYGYDLRTHSFTNLG